METAYATTAMSPGGAAARDRDSRRRPLPSADVREHRTSEAPAGLRRDEAATAAQAGPAGFSESRLWWEYRRTGGGRLRDALVFLYEPWATARTKSFARSRGQDWTELWGAAVVGLIEAIQRFDPSCGVPFTAFAMIRVEGALFDASRQALGRGSRRSKGRETADLARRPREPEDCAHSFACDYAITPEEAIPARDPDPLDQAASNEIIACVLEAMEDARVREIARRRFLLLESVDEIALAVGLGRTRVDELLRFDCLPRARRTLRTLGFVPKLGRR